MNVSLTPRLEKYVKKKVESGLYNSSSEVIREALRLLEENETIKKIRIQELRREIAMGVDQANRGETTVLEVEKIKSEGRKRRSRK